MTPKSKPEKLDLAEIRSKLASAQGLRYWQSLEELAGTEAFEEFLHREFPRQASEWDSGEPGRRKFLKLMGASLALAGMTACTRQPTELIMPYVRAPEEIIPGKPLFYATAMPLHGVATGLLVESHMGRPTKIEGNPGHPASLGATDIFCQASVLTLYDPDRSQTITHYGEITSWNSFFGQFRQTATDLKAKGGAGLRILTETVTSPSLAAQLRAILKDFPAAKWHQYEPGGAHSARAGARLAFGEPVNTYYRVETAKVIVSLDSDFLTAGPGHVRYAREFAKGRQAEDFRLRLYAAESTPTSTGAKADHRWPMRASDVPAFAADLARQLGVSVPGSPSGAKIPPALVDELKKNQGASLIVAGDEQAPAVHALAHAMNRALGNVGKTVVYTEPIEAEPVDQIASLRDLVRDMDAGAVDVLLILGANPLYNAPADIPFAEKFSKVNLRIRIGLYDDETSELCHWHIPGTHYLETWSDTRAYDGTVTIQQPLIAPLYHGKSEHEMLALLSDQPERSAYDLVKGYWQDQKKTADFEAWWRKSVHDGLIEGSVAAHKNVSLKPLTAVAPAAEGVEIIFRPDPAIDDGRFTNNAWLQGLPKPLTKLTWDNAALVGPAMAQKLQLENMAEVELQYNSRKVKAPVWILPGQPADSITIHLGYGRRRAGRVAQGAGFNAYRLRTSDALWSGSSLAIRKTGSVYPLSCTQDHWRMEGRNPVRAGTVAEFRADPDFVQKMGELPPRTLTLYPEWKFEGYAWGMAVDLTACTGCNACVVACQAENNIPVVGKEQVARGREMHWIRIDRYFEGDLDHPSVEQQPVLCMQCENAPCELVCPVAATNHSSEGLNDMVYNRCVGTRYCSNNCPYKVRRFNFFLFSDFVTESLKLQRNPDVTVRSRGVMEKCTYCVQRINEARIEAEKQDRSVRDGEIVTACQQVCPSQAIVFGDVNDKNSRVSKLKASELNYSLLADLNTRPRTTYLASLKNPNPEVEKA
jgi:molybdopterin-containing oxidoreductase family iron-sulfur binding subunit